MGSGSGSGSGSGPKIKTVDFVTEFVEYLLHENAPKITLVVCSTRQSFIRELDGAINLPTQNHEEAQDRTSTTADDTAANLQSSRPRQHCILRKNVGLISSSRRVMVTFCPSIEHLRAFLGLFREELEPENARPYASPILAITDLVAIHSHTPEFSAQGLSRTFALAVEAASKKGAELVLCECKPIVETPDAMHGTTLWKAKVPILSPAVGTRGEDNGSASPTVEIKQIADKWFTFNGSATAID